MTLPDIVPNPTCRKRSFAHKFHEVGFDNDSATAVMAPLADHFTRQELNVSVVAVRDGNPAGNHERFRTLNGGAVQNKGMALFPRKINGHYAMLSRQDDENLFIMFSDYLHYWSDPQILMRPEEAWEAVKAGLWWVSSSSSFMVPGFNMN